MGGRKTDVSSHGNVADSSVLQIKLTLTQCLTPERATLSVQAEQHSGLKQSVFKDVEIYCAVMFKGTYGENICLFSLCN